MTGQSVQTAELMELSFVEQTKTDQHVVERGCVVALRGEEDVRLLGALPEIAYLIQEHPAHDLERAEARADVARPRAGDHVERVDASQRGKRPRPCDVGDVRVEQAAELVNGHELKLERFALVGLYVTHQRRAGPAWTRWSFMFALLRTVRSSTAARSLFPRRAAARPLSSQRRR